MGRGGGRLKRNVSFKKVNSRNCLLGVVDGVLGIGVEVLFVITVDELVETVGTVTEVALCVLGFVPAVAVERVVVTTTSGVTEVELASVEVIKGVLV